MPYIFRKLVENETQNVLFHETKLYKESVVIGNWLLSLGYPHRNALLYIEKLSQLQMYQIVVKIDNNGLLCGDNNGCQMCSLFNRNKCTCEYVGNNYVVNTDLIVYYPQMFYKK